MLRLYRRPGSEIWYLRGTVAGQRVYESSGTGERRRAEILRARREAELLDRHTFGRPATLTFAEAALAYLEAGGEARFLGRLIEYFGPRRRLVEIDNAAAQRAAGALYPGAAWSTINRQVIVPISAVYRFAGDDVPQRTFRKLRPPHRGAGQRFRWLTPEEAERLIAAAAPHLVPVVLFLLGTGARTGEALALTRDRLHLATGEAWLEDTKTGDPRMVRTPPRVTAALAEAELPEAGQIFRTPKGRGYVIRANGGGQIAQAFAQARTAAGLGRDVTPHVLRHTWATWFYAQTAAFGELMDLGGWQKADTCNRYRKPAPLDLPGRLLAHGWDFTGQAAGAAGIGHNSTRQAAGAGRRPA